MPKFNLRSAEKMQKYRKRKRIESKIKIESDVNGEQIKKIGGY